MGMAKPDRGGEWNLQAVENIIFYCKIRTFALLDLAPSAYIEFMISLPERYWVG